MNAYQFFADGTEVLVRIPLTDIVYAGVVSRDSYRLSAFVYVYEPDTGNLHAVHKHNVKAAL